MRAKRGMATVLIGEDQTQILTLAQSLLEEQGYKTLSAQSADDALVVLAGPEPVDALFVDIVLNADMQAGIELAKRAVELKPGLKVVYSTGMTLTDRVKALLVPGAVILEKPYTLDQLLTSLATPDPLAPLSALKAPVAFRPGLFLYVGV
jgi:DNA-binding NtrC family response regulator